MQGTKYGVSYHSNVITYCTFKYGANDVTGYLAKSITKGLSVVLTCNDIVAVRLAIIYYRVTITL